MNQLPKGWDNTTLGAVGSWGSGGTPKRTNKDYYNGEIPWLVIGDLNDGLVYQSKNTITELGVKNSSAKIIEEGTLLIAMYGSIGKLGITGFKCATNQAIANCKVYDDLVNKKYLFYYLKSRQEHLLSLGKGGAQQNISQTVLKAYNCPLAPLKEQIRIADKLDSILAKVDAAQAHLDKIPNILKRFRQSVLAAATSGELINENVDAWNTSPLVSLLSNIADCPHSTPKWTVEGKICIRTTAFKPFNLDLTEQKKVSQETYDERTKRLVPQAGDIVYSREGAILGIACQIPEGVELCLGQRMLVMRAGEKIDPRYLTIVLNSPLITDQIKSLTIGNAAPRINMSVIKNFDIPYPSLKKQKEIVRRFEAIFENADKVEKKYLKAKDHTNRLTQSILAKAFRGELVPQDENDEPASVLLARIEAELTAINTKAKPKTKKKIKAV